MDKFVKVLKISGVIAGVIVVGVLLGWLGGRGKPSANPQVLTPTPAPHGAPVDNSQAASSLEAQAAKNRTHFQSVPSVAAVTPPAPTNLITNWEDRLDQILGADGEDTAKAKELLAMFPRLPEDGKEEVAQHLANLTPDDDYNGLGQYLTNGTLSDSVLDILLSDLLNRPNSVKLPMLYEIARQGDQNPKAGDAKDILQLYLDDDYGDNWAMWQSKMEQWLKDNPD